MEQKVYSFEDHHLSFDKIDSHALYVMEKLRNAGFIAYLVGGSVRDLLLDHQPKDFDISTSAKPEEIKDLFRSCILIGRRFRLAHVRFGKKVIEVSTFRSGDIENQELILRDNQWGYPEQDALRRDFTINGLFYDAATQTIIDYVDGFRDIKQRLLRTIGQPFTRFKQDPVRMIRLLKFRARFGFEIDPDVHIALLECRSEITKSSQSRVLEEVLRMLESGSAQAFIRLMADHGLLSYLLPELAHFLEKQESSDIYSFLQEIDAQIRDPKGLRFERGILLSSLLYPILDEQIKQHYLDRGHIPHLGEIHEHVRKLIQLMFHGFFLIPRRLRMNMTTILTGQYRLTPFEKKKFARRRVPSDPDFPLALEFLSLRSCLEPGLKVILEEWQSANIPLRVKPFRRRKKRKKKPV